MAVVPGELAETTGELRESRGDAARHVVTVWAAFGNVWERTQRLFVEALYSLR